MEAEFAMEAVSSCPPIVTIFFTFMLFIICITDEGPLRNEVGSHYPAYHPHPISLTLVCLSKARTWISIGICLGNFCIQLFEVGGTL
jgi:hypothetical protein